MRPMLVLALGQACRSGAAARKVKGLLATAEGP